MELRLSSVFWTLSAGFCKPLEAIRFFCLFWNIFVQGHDDDDDDDDDDGDDDKDHDDGEEED